jgi:hypothetical protein
MSHYELSQITRWNYYNLLTDEQRLKYESGAISEAANKILHFKSKINEIIFPAA